MTVTSNFQSFVDKHHITIKATAVPENPHIRGDKSWKADHWHCVLSYTTGSDKRTFTCYFSKGIGLRKVYKVADYSKPMAPTAAELLESLQSDISGFTQDFESWAEEYGYSTDSRQAEKTYQTIAQQNRDMSKFLGSAITEFLEITEGE